jgi:hypothetical protein
MRRVVVSACIAMSTARGAFAEPRALIVTGDACDVSPLAGDVAKLGGETFVAGALANVRVVFASFASARVSFYNSDGSEEGTRRVTARNCADLLDSIALVIAMTPSLLDAPPSITVVNLPPVPTPSDPSPPAPSPTAIGRAFDVAVPRARHWDAIVGVGTGVDTREISGVLSAGIRYRRDSLSLSGELQIDIPDRDALAVGRVDVVRAELAIAPCRHFGPLAACAVAAAGGLRGAGVGLEQERAALAPVATFGARLAWEHEIGRRLAVLAHLDADVLATTTKLDVGAMPVWTSPRAEAVAGFGLAAHFL